MLGAGLPPLPPGTAGGGLAAAGVAAGGFEVPMLALTPPHAAVAPTIATKATAVPKRMLLMATILRYAG